MRLFFALGLEEKTNQAAREQLARYKDSLSGIGHAVPDQNLHLTLAFLGDVPDANFPALQQQAEALSLPAFSITLSDVDIWAQPQIACATLKQPPQTLFDLANHLRALPAWPAKPDNHAFTPHITLRRGVTREGRSFLPSLPVQTFACQRFGLYASPSSRFGQHRPHNREERALYQCLHQFDLCC